MTGLARQAGGPRHLGDVAVAASQHARQIGTLEALGPELLALVKGQIERRLSPGSAAPRRGRPPDRWPVGRPGPRCRGRSRDACRAAAAAARPRCAARARCPASRGAVSICRMVSGRPLRRVAAELGGEVGDQARDVLAALAQRRQRARGSPRAGRRGPAGSRRRCDLLPQVAVGGRDDAARRPARSGSRRRVAPRASPARAGAWAAAPAAARQSRRGTGCRRRPPRRAPALALAAPVKAPLSWPKSSLSMSSAGSAPQSTATKGPPRRGEPSCSARAASSLPVPDSPSRSTVLSVSATRSRMAKTWRMAGLEPEQRAEAGASAQRDLELVARGGQLEPRLAGLHLGCPGQVASPRPDSRRRGCRWCCRGREGASPAAPARGEVQRRRRSDRRAPDRSSRRCRPARRGRQSRARGPCPGLWSQSAGNAAPPSPRRRRVQMIRVAPGGTALSLMGAYLPSQV